MVKPIRHELMHISHRCAKLFLTMDTCIMDGLKPKLLVFKRKGKDLVQGKALWAWKYIKMIFREEML